MTIHVTRTVECDSCHRQEEIPCTGWKTSTVKGGAFGRILFHTCPDCQQGQPQLALEGA